MAIKFSWEERIERARHLAGVVGHARQILDFYLELLKWQRDLFGRLSAAAETRPFTGAFASDRDRLLEHCGSLLTLIRGAGSETLAAQIDQFGTDPEGWGERLAEWWNGESDPAQSLFARTCLQPYLELLVRTGTPPFDSRINAFAAAKLEAAQPHRACPFCGRRPQLALLSDDPSMPGAITGGVVEGAADGGRRFLMCGDCSTIWPFQRIACPNCPEVDPHRLPYYAAQEFPNMRVECCESCKHYLKSIDLTKDRRPIPPVDELAAISLDLWAAGRNYVKIQPNLAGI